MFCLREEEGIYYGQTIGPVKSGFGVYEWHDGSKYEGEWRDNEMSGWGILETSKGGTYCGYFKNNKLHNQGRCTFPNEDIYIGNWSRGKTHGYGVFYYKDLHSYDLCLFDHGKQIKLISQGKGVPTHLDFVHNAGVEHPKIYYGNKYIGESMNGNREGKGILYISDGSRFEGHWVNDEPNGIGVYYYNDQTWNVGHYEGGKLHGLGVAHFASGDQYLGAFSHGMMHGAGKYYVKSRGSWYRGEFCENNCVYFEEDNESS